MAQTQAAGMDPKANDWLQIIWAQWTRVIIIIIQEAQTNQGNDFGSYAALLDSVKNEA